MSLEEKLKQQIKENPVLIYMRAHHMSQDADFHQKRYKH